VKRYGATQDLVAICGESLGVSNWTSLSERDLQEFGRLTGDEHWIHVDPERAAAEGPFGSVIAHGFLTLALITGLHNECYTIDAARRWVNYGLDRVRFLRPLTPGTDVRLEVTLEEVDIVPTGGRLRLGCSLVTRSGDPVVVATWLVLVIEAEEAA
jgi:acyl dehydratase